jgi:hypothetical protein
MVGTWLVNVIFGLLGFTIVFFAAFMNNGFITSLIRGVIAYVSFFLIAYLFRWMIYFIISDPKGDTTYNETVNNRNSNTNDSQQMEHSMDKLSDEDAKLVSGYIKDLLKQKE